MKIKERALSLLLSLVMVLTFMPALAFADSPERGDITQIQLTHEGDAYTADGYLATDGYYNDDNWVPTSEEYVQFTAPDPVVGDKLYVTYEGIADPIEYVAVQKHNNEYDYDYVAFQAKDNEEDVINTYSVWVNEQTFSNPFTAGTTQSFKICVTDDVYDTANAFLKEEHPDEPQSTWELDYEGDVNFQNSPVTLKVTVTGEHGTLSYSWEKYDNDQEAWNTITGETEATLVVSESGSYRCTVIETETSNDKIAFFDVYPFADYYTVSSGGLSYELYSTDESQGAQVWCEDVNGPSSEISIPESITLSNGKAYPVRYVYWLGANVMAVHIPSSVTYISDSIGLNWSEDASGNETWSVKPGFVIYGTNGTYAQTYANKYGISFRDLAAEAAAALNGTQIGGLPKVKISKPKAAKKAVTVKWKKLKKKQLKTGVTNIEVWIATDPQFTNLVGQPRIIGKKKSSLKIKGLQKGVTYYVKVRAIKNVGGVKYYSSWSGLKSVKVKK